MSLRNKPIVPSSRNNRPALLKQWRAIFDADPPLRIGVGLLATMVEQAQQESQVASAVRSLAKHLASYDQPNSSMTKSKATLHLGDRLVRGWGGTNHEIIILQKGFSYRGKIYGSLSEIARLITGTRWSGPRFFGVLEKNG